MGVLVSSISHDFLIIMSENTSSFKNIIFGFHTSDNLYTSRFSKDHNKYHTYKFEEFFIKNESVIPVSLISMDLRFLFKPATPGRAPSGAAKPPAVEGCLSKIFRSRSARSWC